MQLPHSMFGTLMCISVNIYEIFDITASTKIDKWKGKNDIEEDIKPKIPKGKGVLN